MNAVTPSPNAYIVLNTRTGDVVDEFGSLDEAMGVLLSFALKYPEDASVYAMIPIDDEGHSLGPGVLGSEVSASA